MLYEIEAIKLLGDQVVLQDVKMNVLSHGFTPVNLGHLVKAIALLVVDHVVVDDIFDLKCPPQRHVFISMMAVVNDIVLLFAHQLLRSRLGLHHAVKKIVVLDVGVHVLHLEL